MAATPALAATATPGFAGPADIPTDRAAPFTLPAFSPKPLPQVEPGTSRDIFDTLTPEAALSSLTTVTLSKDGTTREIPASDELRAIFEDWVKGNTGE